MKNDKWLVPEKVCLAQGHCVAKNVMFENLEDKKLFITLWKKYLGGMTDIVNYQLAHSSWVVLFKTKTPEEIQSAYQAQRAQSKKAKSKYNLTNVSKILSEHFRIFLSQYARRMNSKNGRKGTLVFERFKKLVFEKYTDYVAAYENIVNNLLESPQTQPKYQEEERKLEKQKVKRLRVDVGLGLWRLLARGSEDFGYVLRKFFNTTRKAISPPNST